MNMKAIKYLLNSLVIIALISSCTDSRLEQRVKNLEERVAQLEKGGDRNIVKPTSNLIAEW